MKVKSKVIEIGEQSDLESEPVMILFNASAPEGLREICIIHEFEDSPQENLLRPGSKICFNDKEYTIKEIGHVANQTLRDLGHISLYFHLDEDTELLPGSALLVPNKKPQLKEGDTITFIQ